MAGPLPIPLMRATSGPPPVTRALALTLAAVCTALLGLPDSGVLPPLAAAALTVGWAAAGFRQIGPPGLAALVPALGLLPYVGATPGAFSGWSAAGLALAAAWALTDGQKAREATRDLRHRLVLAERGEQNLHGSLTRFPALLDACLAFAQVRDMDHLAEILCREVRTLVPKAQRVRVHVGVASQLACRASADATGRPLPTEPAAEEFYVATEARVLTRREGDSLRVLLPLRGERRSEHGREALCGVLDVVIARDESEEHLHLDLLRALAQLGGIGLAAVDLVGQARSLALRDDLTGLFGQHEFLRRLDEQVAAARRHGHQLGVVMCDLDHLKRFNDSYGHPAGDEALKAVARAVRKAVSDTPGAAACRYGGEEFALVLPGIAGNALLDLGDRLRLDIAAALPDPQRPERRLTASLGLATLRPNENGRAVLIRADAACYRAKAEGRNRCSAADDLGSVDAATMILPAIGGSTTR